MDGKRTYQIQINGISESISAVDALNKQLLALENRIKELEKSDIKINASGGSTKTTTDDSVSKQKELNQLKKEELQTQKEIAAQQRLTAGEYDNTMKGMKQNLADIKTVMNATDLGNGDQIKQLTKDAGELNKKLLEIEKSYGQFGRNVGNYPKEITEGFKGINIAVAGTVQQFDNAKQALKTLQGELRTLQVKKDQGMFLSKEELERFNELPTVVAQIKSSIQDAGKPMDNLMDSMQSVVAVAQTTKGFSAFFGLDSDEIDRSIQKLVALQNAMKGLQTIQKQLQSQEGIGKMFASGSKSIDSFTAKITGAKVGVEGLEKSTKVGTVAVRGLSTALKALGSVGILAAITAIFYAIEKGVEWVSNWVKGDADLVNAEDALTASLNQQNKVLEDNIDLIQKRVAAGEITAEQAKIEREEAYAKAIEETKKKLIEREQIYQQAGIVKSGKSGIHLENIYGDTGVTSFGGFDKGIKSIEDFNKRWDLLSTAVANGTDALNKWNYTADDSKDDLAHMAKMVGGDMVNAFYKFADGTTEGTKQLVEYINHMDELTGNRYTQALKLGIDKGFLDGQFKLAFEQYQKLKTDIYKDPIVAKLQLDADIKTALDGIDPTRRIQEDIDKWNGILKKGVNEAGETLTMYERACIAKIIAAREKQLKETRNRTTSKISSNYKKYQKEVTDAENELNRLRIAQMKEGLNKTIKQLEEERRQKLAKIKSNSELYNETVKYYDNKIEEEKKKHAENIEKIYSDMWKNINAKELENINKEIENIENYYEILRSKNDREYAPDRSVSSYGVIGKENMPDVDNLSANKSEFATEMKGYIDLYREFQTVSDEIRTAEIKGDKELLADKQNEHEQLKSEHDNYLSYLKEKYGEETVLGAKEKLIQESYSSDLSTIFKQRIAAVDKYWTARIKTEEEAINTLYDKQIEAENKRYKIASGDAKSSYDSSMKQYEQYLENELITTENYIKEVTKLYNNYRKEQDNLEFEHEYNTQKLHKDAYDKYKKTNGEYLQDILQQFRDFQTNLSEISSRASETPRTMLGLIDIAKNKAQLKKAIGDFETAFRKIQEKRRKLNEDFKNGLIDKETYEAGNRELDAQEQYLSNQMTELKKKLEEAGDDIWANIAAITEFVGTFVNEAITSIATIINNSFDAEIDKQEEYINKLETMYDKQKDITQKYADDINSIEDELKTARGDRRQQLIDQLNAEMAAQRESLAQEKKIEKEKEKAEKKKKELQRKQAEADKKASLWQAAISTAVAVTNGLATKPFFPLGIAMGTLAATLGALQIAAISSKPIPTYATGGVIEGPSHAAGGVKVLGGQAEVEGKEFITNKVTTQENVDLMYYINSKKRKLNIDDFIEFYSGGTVKKNIQSVRTKFADGGQIQTLRNDITINDRLITAMEDYAERPVQVAVVDIIDRTQAVNDVKVMAGLEV